MGNILLRSMVSVPLKKKKNFCYFPPQAGGLAFMEKLPSRGAKDWEGLRRKRPSLWTVGKGVFWSTRCFTSRAPSRGRWSPLYGVDGTLQGEEVEGGEATGLDSQSWEGVTLLG